MGILATPPKMLLTGCVLSTALVLPPAPLATRTAAQSRRGTTQMALGGHGVDFPELDGSSIRIGIIKARWHPDICDSLVSGAKSALAECGVPEENIIENDVPGSFELPLATRYLALSGTVDAILPVGVLIKGDTTHFEVISEAVTDGLMSVGLQTGIPTIFGVLTCMDEAQAIARSTGDNNHGIDWGKAAVEMALLRTSAVGTGKGKLFLGFGNAEDSSSGGGTKKAAEKVGF